MSYKAPRILGVAGVSVTYGSPSITVSGVPGGVAGASNLAFSYASGTGTFTVHGADGTALSATNPAYVTLQNKTTSSQLVTIAVTANQNFIDDNGASEIIGNLFGLTTGVAAASNIPFYLYAVSNDSQNAISFMISRFPFADQSPSSANIGTPASAVADVQGAFFAFDSVTVTEYDQNPCLCIGSFRMTMSASDDWTVTTLTNQDGIGRFQNGRLFSAIRGQFGAASGKYFKDNGGTAPDDADGGYTYYVDPWNKKVMFNLAFPVVDTAGVGAVTAQLALPYIRFEGGSFGTGDWTTGGGVVSLLSIYSSATSNTANFTYANASASGILQNADVAASAGLGMGGSFTIYNNG